MDNLIFALCLQVPIVIGGVLHMMAVTHDWLPNWRTPIHEGLLGRNKTWRGMILMPVFTALGGLLLWPLWGDQSLAIGATVGLGYMLAEWPNSFIKRRLGIQPGATPRQHAWMGVMADQLDSAIGAALAYALYPGVEASVCMLYVLTFPLTALAVKRLLFMAKLKRSAV